MMNITIIKRLSRDGKKAYYTLEWGRNANQRKGTGIFTYVHPATLLEKNHNKEALAILETKKAQMILDSQARQARENFDNSAYREQLKVYHRDIKHFTPAGQYDLIVSNPPFFENDLKSEDQKRNLALHGEKLTFQELIIASKPLLNEKGIFAVLLPYQRTVSFLTLAQSHDLYLHKQVLLKQTEKHNYFRSILVFVHHESVIEKSEIMIRKQGEYSAEFVTLLKDYYLFL